MATRNKEKSKVRSKSPKRSRRSISPNNVVINGQIIDREHSENLVLSGNNFSVPKHLLLDNITEESDPTLPDSETSQDNLSVPLENAVKIADENVQKFIQEMSNNSKIKETLNEFKAVCSKSQEELKGLSNFLSTIDDESKNKIVDTLINVYKQEVLCGVKNNVGEKNMNVENRQVNDDPADKINKFKNVCKGLINEYKMTSINEESLKNPKVVNVGPRSTNGKEILQHSESGDFSSSLAQNIKNICKDNISSEINHNNNSYLKNIEQNLFSSVENCHQEESEINKIKENNKKEKKNNKLVDDFPKFLAADLPTYKNIPQCSFKEDELVTEKPSTQLNLQEDYVVNYHIKSSLLDNSHTYTTPKVIRNLNYEGDSNDTHFSLSPDFGEFQSNFNGLRTNICSKKEYNTFKGNQSDTFRIYDLESNIDLKICLSKEQAINRILNRQRENKPERVKFLDEIRRNTEYGKIKVKSEGVQASYGRSRKSLNSTNYIQIVKPYKYHPDYFGESKSDIAIECPYGCLLKIKKSKSDTDLEGLRLNKKKFPKHKTNKTKRRGKLTKNETKGNKSTSLIKVDLKPSIQLLQANGVRRKKQMINYLEDDLKRGDSEYQVSQILFEMPVKNIDNDASSLVIPALDEKQVNSFNANYLLHAIKIQKKSDILPVPNFSSQYFNYSVSNPSITEEDYRTWLKKQNWSKYSKIVNKIQSLENLRSISETMQQTPSKESRGEFGYYLERGDSTKQPSTAEQASTFLSDFSELFLYEQVVISKFINLCCTFNAKRTKVLTTMDRFLQVIFFVFFYGVWVFLDNYIFVEPKPKSGRLLWK